MEPGSEDGVQRVERKRYTVDGEREIDGREREREREGDAEMGDQ